MKTLTKLEIIEEIVSFYSEDTNRRSLRSYDDQNICCYKSGDNFCAVGKCMTKESIDKLIYSKNNAVSLLEIQKRFNTNLDQMLEQKYQGHEINFWISVQCFHDTHEHFKKNKGLTEKGKKYVKSLKKQYS